MADPGRARRRARPRTPRRRCRPARSAVRDSSRWPPGDLHGRAVANDGHAERLERALRMIPGRRRFDDPGAPGRVQAREQHARSSPGRSAPPARARFPWSPPPSMVSGGRPPAASIRAPMRVSGSMTRRIGRRCSESSPPITLRNGCPARIPASSRIVVPELTASSGASAARSPPTPRPAIAQADGPVGRIATPSARRQASVAAQSAPGEYPLIAGLAVGQRGEQGVSVRNRFVSGHADASCGAHRGPDGDRIGGRAEHEPHYSIRTLEGIRFTMLFIRVPLQPAVFIRSRASGRNRAGGAAFTIPPLPRRPAASAMSPVPRVGVPAC